jgi:hypothetical protein
VPRVLTINAINATGLLSLGLGVCQDSLAASLGEGPSAALAAYLARLAPGTETRLVRAATQGNLTQLVRLLPSLFPSAGLLPSHTEALAGLVAPFTAGELLTLMDAFRTANLTEKDLKVIEEVAKTGKDDLANAERVLMKINFDNLPEITRLLDLLGIQLTDLITNPGIFFEFFGDEEKSAILVELQGLLPKFRPADIEVFLQLQDKLNEAQLKYGDPEATPLMEKLFNVPMDILLSLSSKVKLDESANAGFDAFKLLQANVDFKLVSSAGSALLDPAALDRLVKGCTAQRLDVEFLDEQRVGHHLTITSSSFSRCCLL